MTVSIRKCLSRGAHLESMLFVGDVTATEKERGR